jgi:8-oxo-dGTP pyrophosphatase MutT (NUDIX family)/phosphohistidine phosphatase SixA
MTAQPAPAAPDEVRAAGAVLWRPGAQGPQVALVHRPRYDDWSFPKGKRLPGEHVLLTAVREVAEETGIRVSLGRRLPSARYDQDGRPKVVDYWAARAAEGPQPGFQPNDEVDQLDWLEVAAARDRLSYPHDARILDEFTAGPPDTIPLILLRHAAAGSKEDWHQAGLSDDLKRPLDEEGVRQAAALAPLLGCYPMGRVLSSVAERCVATVRPYAAEAGLQVQADEAFTVGLATVERARHRVGEVVAGERPAVICAHRENLPVLLQEACAVLGTTPPDSDELPRGGFWVLHIGWSALAGAERHHPLPPGSD